MYGLIPGCYRENAGEMNGVTGNYKEEPKQRRKKKKMSEIYRSKKRRRKVERLLDGKK